MLGFYLMLYWPDIDTVLFDMDGTLLDLHFDNYFWEQQVPEAIAARTGISTELAWQQLRAEYQALHGKLDWYCIDYWTDRLQLDIQGMKEAAKDRIAIRANVEPMLRQLRTMNKKLLLVTNAHPGSLRLKMQHTSLHHYFDRIISSHTLGMAKENAGFWQVLQDHEHFDPQRSVLFDDNLHVLRQAKAEGIRHLYAIRQPDSRRDPVPAEEFRQIIDFADILPCIVSADVCETVTP
jgi:putative hydrolase of the HAD superfamily